MNSASCLAPASFGPAGRRRGALFSAVAGPPRINGEVPFENSVAMGRRHRCRRGVERSTRLVALERWGHWGPEGITGRPSHRRYLEAVKEGSSDAGGGLALSMR